MIGKHREGYESGTDIEERNRMTINNNTVAFLPSIGRESSRWWQDDDGPGTTWLAWSIEPGHTHTLQSWIWLIIHNNIIRVGRAEQIWEIGIERGWWPPQELEERDWSSRGTALSGCEQYRTQYTIIILQSLKVGTTLTNDKADLDAIPHIILLYMFWSAFYQLQEDVLFL